MPKSKPAVEMVERDRTVHDLAAHMQHMGGDDPKKQDDAATYIMKRWGEDGLALPGAGAEKSLGWYQSWGMPPKCPTCGAPANITSEPKE